MKHDMDIPMELYEDDAVCYIASRYHVSTQEAVRGFLVQSDIVHGTMSDFHLEDNEIEIMKGLMDAYSSTKGENLNTWNDGQKKFFAKVIDGSIAGSQ